MTDAPQSPRDRALATVRGFYAAFHAGDKDALLSVVSPNVSGYERCVPGTVPSMYGTTGCYEYNNRDEFEHLLFVLFHTHVRIFAFDIDESSICATENGDAVSLRGGAKFEELSTGNLYSARESHRIRLDADGKISSFTNLLIVSPLSTPESKREESLSLILRLFDSYLSKDMDAFFGCMDPEKILWHGQWGAGMLTRAANADGTYSYSGQAEVLKLYTEILAGSYEFLDLQIPDRSAIAVSDNGESADVRIKMKVKDVQTGEEYNVEQSQFYRFEDGKIVEGNFIGLKC